MKKYLLLACAAGILSISSCSESEVSEVVDNTPKKMTFTVGTSASETRASVRTLESQNPAVDWDETDQLYVWGLGNTEPALFSFSQYGNYHNYAAFIGSIIPAAKYYLMYPNVSGSTIVFDENQVGHITTTIPAVQKATKDSFDPAAAICTGATQGNMDTKVEVQHACAFLKITTTKPCYSVTVTPGTDKTYSMTGEVYIETSSAGSAIKPPFPNGVKSVTLTADGTANCSSTFPAGTYLIAVIPSTGYPGIEITVDYGLGEYNPHVLNENVIQMNAANIYNLGVAKVDPIVETLTASASPSAATEDTESTDPDTRAAVRTLETQNPAVDWEDNDKLFVWGLGDTDAAVFSFKQYGNYHNYAEFTGTIEPSTKYYVMYPNVSGTTMAFDAAGVGLITTTIPPVQKATLESFDPAAAICTGATKGNMDKKVEVQHACAFLKITTTRSCYSVTVTPGTDKTYSMTGEVYIETSSAGSAIKPPFPNGVKSVTLTADGTANCTSTFPAGTYLIAVIPSTGYPGIEITVDYGLGANNPHVLNEDVIQMNAANIYNLGVAEVKTGESTGE
jgi:hypothetical protein